MSSHIPQHFLPANALFSGVFSSGCRDLHAGTATVFPFFQMITGKPSRRFSACTFRAARRKARSAACLSRAEPLRFDLRFIAFIVRFSRLNPTWVEARASVRYAGRGVLTAPPLAGDSEPYRSRLLVTKTISNSDSAVHPRTTRVSRRFRSDARPRGPGRGGSGCAGLFRT